MWQFLAALAVGATSPEHQQILVTEVRDRIIERSRGDDASKGVGNVNLFLNALGLGIDASHFRGI